MQELLQFLSPLYKLNQFYCRFETVDIEPVVIPVFNEPSVQCFTVLQEDVRRVLSRTKVRKAPGPDGIPPHIHRLCSEQLAPVLTDLFNVTQALYHSASKGLS